MYARSILPRGAALMAASLTTCTAEPPVWFHDLLRRNGQPYEAKEVDYIKKRTGAK